MSFESHPQYGFLKDAGMSHEQIVNYITKDLGLRERHKDKDRDRNLLQPSKPKLIKAIQPDKEKKKELPSSLSQFTKEYSIFMKHSSSKTTPQWRQDHIKMLYRLISKVKKQHGIIQIISIGSWRKLIQQLKTQSKQFEFYPEKELFLIYLQNLVQYQFYLNGQELTINKGVNLQKTLAQALFIEGNQLRELIRDEQKGLGIFREEIVVFSQGVDQLGIDYSDINLAKIEKECGEQIVDIRIQNPLDYGFNVLKLTNICHKLTIREYCDYQRNYKSQSYKKNKFGDQLKGGKVFFAVNFEPQQLNIFSSLWNKLQGNFLGFCQKFDLLSYLDSDIPGCSSPQFYLKVKGCWTGGHQENIAMCAVNINHGPDPSQWFTIPYGEVEKVRKVLLEKFKCDLYRQEGLWYQKINWFIQNGYPIKRILQRKGDIVVSGPGTLHWVRSFGIALQSAWNIFPKTYHQIQCALHRHHQNLLLKLQKSSTIPLKSLLIKYLQHELYSIDDRTLQVILVALQQWLSQQQRLRLQLMDICDLGIENSVEFKLGDLESSCQLCKQEIFIYFLESWTGQGIVCLQCLTDNPIIHGSTALKFYYKYNHFHLKNLLTNAHNRKKQSQISNERMFCNGQHIGKVECSIKQQKSRKRQRQSCIECQVTVSNESNHQNIQRLMDLIERQNGNNQTIGQLALQNNINLAKTVSVQIQTCEYQCPHCDRIIDFQHFKPTKRYCNNDRTIETKTSSKVEQSKWEQTQRQKQMSPVEYEKISKTDSNGEEQVQVHEKGSSKHINSQYSKDNNGGEYKGKYSYHRGDSSNHDNYNRRSDDNKSKDQNENKSKENNENRNKYSYHYENNNNYNQRNRESYTRSSNYYRNKDDNFNRNKERQYDSNQDFSRNQQKDTRPYQNRQNQQRHNNWNRQVGNNRNQNNYRSQAHSTNNKYEKKEDARSDISY